MFKEDKSTKRPIYFAHKHGYHGHRSYQKNVIMKRHAIKSQYPLTIQSTGLINTSDGDVVFE
ncbi:MAG: hypothetical protein J6S29_01145 [Methanosphaera sp.]|nr:hypothetical protein [Methanosphaera sp.]